MRLDKKNTSLYLQRNFLKYCFQLSDTIETTISNLEIFNQVNIEELIRGVRKEEAMRLLK